MKVIHMDYPITAKKKSRLRLCTGFQALDIIPYSIALIMLCGSIYIVVMAIELTKHSL